MKKCLLLVLLIVTLVPVSVFVVDQSTLTAKDRVTAAPSTPKSPAWALGFAQWFATKGKTATSSCGPNFCTQAQRTQCARSCRHAPFVGLECCEATCTSFCNCGSVPTGGC